MITNPDPAKLDYSMFSQEDLLNIVLQRSEVLTDVRRPGQIIREWTDNRPQRLVEAVVAAGPVLAERAVAVIGDEFAAIQDALDQIKPAKIADIGCGYAFFDLFAHARYGCDILLIDIEKNERRHFGFHEEAAAYTSLAVAQQFLTANGVPAEKISTWNPEKGELPDGETPSDLAVSFLSCGYHFPVDSYMPFFRFGLTPGGAVILDLRGRAARENTKQLEELGQVDVIWEGKNNKRVLVQKAA